MQFLKRQLLVVVATATAMLGLVIVPASATPPALEFQTQDDMGQVINSVSIGTGVNTKIFAVSPTYALKMETPVLNAGTNDTSVNTQGCEVMDLTVDATYLWLLCMDMSGRRILLSSITTTSNAANTIDTFTVPSNAYGYNSCRMSDIFSDGTYVDVEASSGQLYQMDAGFTAGGTPTMAAIQSRGFELGQSCYHTIRPMVVGSTTYNFYYNQQSGRLNPILIQAQWTEMLPGVSYDGNYLFSSVSIMGEQMWAFQLNADKALHFDPSDITAPPVVVSFGTNDIYGVAFDGTELWTTRNSQTTICDARSVNTGNVLASATNCSDPNPIVRWGDLVYGVLDTGVWVAVRVPAQPTVPGPPTGLTISVNDGMATMKWVAPADHGATPLTGYVARVIYGNSQMAGTCQTTTLTCSVNVGSLGYGSVMTARVAARNSAGASEETFSINYGMAGNQVVFPDTSGVLGAAQKATLQRWIKGFCPNNHCSGLTFNITGYTDNSVSGAVATQQCNARSMAVRGYLISLMPGIAGVNARSYTTVVGGATNKWDKNTLAGNRRVVISVKPTVQ